MDFDLTAGPAAVRFFGRTKLESWFRIPFILCCPAIDRPQYQRPCQIFDGSSISEFVSNLNSLTGKD